MIAQLDLTWQLDPCRPGECSLGVWTQTGRTATAGTNTTGVRDVPGCYVQWQQTVAAATADIAADGGGVAFFGQFGWSDPNKNPIHWSLMTGLSATGIVPCRPADALGMMFAYSQFTDNPAVFQSQQRSGLAGPAGGHEMSLEAFYIYQWSSCTYLQPGVMWIGDPGGGQPTPLTDNFLPYLLVGVEF